MTGGVTSAVGRASPVIPQSLIVGAVGFWALADPEASHFERNIPFGDRALALLVLFLEGWH